MWIGFLTLALGVTRLAGAADTADNTALDRYLAGMKTLSTQFTQSVSDAKGNAVDSGAGTLVVQRPGEFRWDYHPQAATSAGSAAAADPDQSGQLLVADGKNLWFYDRELAQVSVKPVESALSATPVMLLSGSDKPLRDTFDLSAGGHRDGLDWVDVKPRAASADFNDAQFGFAGDQLLRMIVHDRLGQTVRLDFVRSERNGHVDPALLTFKPPADVDVIGTPKS